MIKARNIIKSYQNGESRFQVLKDISLDIEDNDFVVILGASGSGKSTFLNVISGLERPDSGKVFFKRSSGYLLCIVWNYTVFLFRIQYRNLCNHSGLCGVR